MQSAPRAVTCSHHASRHPYASSRHALTQPARCIVDGSTTLPPSIPSTIYGSQYTASPVVLAAPSMRRHSSRRNSSTLVLSQPAAQKRCASSKPKPPATKPMVYNGRTTKDDLSRILSSNPYMRGRGNLSPSGSPNAIFDPQIRRPDAATPSKPPQAPDPIKTPSTALPNRNPQPDPPTPVPPPNLPSTTPYNSSQTPLRSAPDRDLAHAVDDVAVPKGTTQSKEARTIDDHQRVESTESRVSVFEQVVRLEQKNTTLTSALAKQRKDYQDLKEAHQRLRESSTRTIQDVQRLELQARKKLQAQLTNFEIDRSGFQSTIRKQDALQTKLSQQLSEVKQELADERHSSTQRRLADYHYEATARLREQDEKSKAARKLSRKDYRSLQEFAHDGARKTSAMLKNPEHLRLKATWYKREAAYWTNAIKAAQSYQAIAKGGDQFRFWEAGEQVQQKTRDPQARDALRQQLVRRLELRLQHRDSVFEQVKGYLQHSGLEADRARLEYVDQLEQLRALHKTLLSRQHDWRRLVRETRYDMNPKTSSPEVTAASRASSIDLYEMDRPLVAISGAMFARRDFWKHKLRVLRAQENHTIDTEPLISFYTTQIKALSACSSLLGTVRMFSALQLEALEADWISEQPAYQQLSWQNIQRVARRVTHTRTRTGTAVNGLMDSGVMDRHRILSMRDMPKIMDASKLHERAAFAYAYVKHKQNAFTPDDMSEIRDVFAVYRQENQQDSKRHLRQLEQVLRVTDEIRDVRQSATMGKRLLVPARIRRRETLRKAALAKTKQDEDMVEGHATPINEAAADTTTDNSRSAAGAEMTSSPGSTSNLENSEANQRETTQSLEKAAPSQSKDTTGPLPVEASADSAEEAPQAENKPRGPAFKLVKQGLAPIPRLTPKTPTVYSRARSKAGFRPPKPMFKETRRRSQIMGSSTADCLDQEELSHSTLLPPLMYQIPPNDLRNALMASKTSQAAFWRYSLYKSPNGEKPRLHYCTKLEQAEQVARLFSGEQIIGFDIEWEMGSTVTKSSIKDNVSLIQIACDDRIALFQVALFTGDSKEELMPPSLKAILESPDILKTGVNVSGDFTRLRKCLGVEGQGIFELSHLYKLVKFSEKEPAKVNKVPFKLAEQVQDVLFLPLHKGNVRTSAWSKRLDMEQVVYAASDAYAGFRLFRELEKTRSMMNPTPPRPALWELDQPIILGNGERVGLARTKRKPATAKVPEAESQPSVLSVEEEQALDDEEEETEAEAGADDQEGENDQNEVESFDEQPAAIVRHEAAEQWLDRCQSELPQRCVRAYALWQVQGLELQQVAEAMREPPLALTTVANYILEVVKSESLPYESARLQEALDVLPSVAHWRYKSLIQKTRSEI